MSDDKKREEAINNLAERLFIATFPNISHIKNDDDHEKFSREHVVRAKKAAVWFFENEEGDGK
jgi:hypothetical protein